MNKKNKGQSLFEVVIALGVISLILVTIISLTLLSVKNTSATKSRSQATRLSQDTKEWLGIEKNKSWSDFVAKTAVSKRCLKELDWTTAGIGSCNYLSETDNVAGTLFDREITMSINGQQTEVTTVVDVSWTDSQGFHKITTSTIFQNWR